MEKVANYACSLARTHTCCRTDGTFSQCIGFISCLPSVAGANGNGQEMEGRLKKRKEIETSRMTGLNFCKERTHNVLARGSKSIIIYFGLYSPDNATQVNLVTSSSSNSSSSSKAHVHFLSSGILQGNFLLSLLSPMTTVGPYNSSTNRKWKNTWQHQLIIYIYI